MISIASKQTPPVAFSRRLVSYAQNLEDVMLWRAVGYVPAGFYVDVGAQDPRSDSVSRAFYENGWRGVHVEPSRNYARLLRADRPDETVIEAALGEHTGDIPFWEAADTGLSTGSHGQAGLLSGQGHLLRKTTAAGLTLANVLAPHAARDIHWLKIDVEGMEESVLRGWGDSAVRPWIIVIESTALDGRPNHHGWEPLLIDRGYTFAYFDGLNRFYVSRAHPELLPSFSHPPCVFDDYQLSPLSPVPSSRLLKARIAELAGENAISKAEIARLRALLYAASVGQHLYRAFQRLLGNPNYNRNPDLARPTPPAQE